MQDMKYRLKAIEEDIEVTQNKLADLLSLRTAYLAVIQDGEPNPVRIAPTKHTMIRSGISHTEVVRNILIRAGATAIKEYIQEKAAEHGMNRIQTSKAISMLKKQGRVTITDDIVELRKV